MWKKLVPARIIIYIVLSLMSVYTTNHIDCITGTVSAADTHPLEQSANKSPLPLRELHQNALFFLTHLALQELCWLKGHIVSKVRGGWLNGQTLGVRTQLEEKQDSSAQNQDAVLSKYFV